MTQGLIYTLFSRTGIRAIALVAALACLAGLSAAPASSSLLNNQGYILLHPMFKSMPWKSTLGRLDLILPDTISNITVKSFDVSRGVDNAVAMFSVAGNGLFVMPVLHEKLVAPCYDHALTFDPPKKVTLNGLSFSSDKPLYLIRDSLYSADSVRVVVPSSIAPLRLLVATIRIATAAVTRIDTVTLAERRTGQQVVGVSGATNETSQQDTGLWVSGSNGMVRYVPYANHRLGVEAVRDLPEATVTATHMNGAYAVTTQGRIFRKNPADTFFTFVVAASGALRRVYPQGAIGDNGLFKENVNNVWKTDKNFGSASYRYANFIRRPGGFGVELLDSSWAYSVFTYRDTSTRISATAPASLSTNINGLPYAITTTASQDITVMLDDLDSNFSDYTLSLVTGASSVDLKNDLKYTIAPLSDSADCHIGSIKMTSGRLRLTLTGSQITVLHDCALGALDPTCLSCYWKKYDFQLSRSWKKSDTIKIKTGQHLLRIVNSIDPSTVTLMPFANRNPGNSDLVARFASGSEFRLRLPLKPGVLPVTVSLLDLQGRLLASMSLQRDRRSFDLPVAAPRGIVIVSCRMSDGTVVSAKVPVIGRYYF
jgi:hypothetical protein